MLKEADGDKHNGLLNLALNYNYKSFIAHALDSGGLILEL
jgi:hypothetical protein